MQYAQVMRDGSLRCPKCESTSLSVERRKRDFLVFGLLLTPKRMRCNACGTWCDRPAGAKIRA